MAIRRSASQRPYLRGDYVELEVDGEPVEQISCDGTIDKDLDIRIQRANGDFHQLWKIWNSRTIKTPTGCTRLLSSLSYCIEIRLL